MFSITDYKYFTAATQNCVDAVNDFVVYISRPLQTCNAGYNVRLVRTADNAVIVEQSGVWARDAQANWELQLAGTVTDSDRTVAKGTGSIKIQLACGKYDRHHSKLYWYFVEPAEGDIPSEGISATLQYLSPLPPQ